MTVLRTKCLRRLIGIWAMAIIIVSVRRIKIFIGRLPARGVDERREKRHKTVVMCATVLLSEYSEKTLDTYAILEKKEAVERIFSLAKRLVAGSNPATSSQEECSSVGEQAHCRVLSVLCLFHTFVSGRRRNVLNCV